MWVENTRSQRGEREREREKAINELSLLPGWAQCFYYLRLTGCEAIHSGGCEGAIWAAWEREGDHRSQAPAARLGEHRAL